MRSTIGRNSGLLFNAAFPVEQLTLGYRKKIASPGRFKPWGFFNIIIDLLSNNKFFTTPPFFQDKYPRGAVVSEVKK